MVHADYSNLKSGQLSKRETLQHVLDSYEALKTPNWVANLSNCASLLWYAYKSLDVEVNWTGFYLTSVPDDELILGPFQGKVACQTIKFGKGVCGSAASSQKTQLVPNVEEFPGHIACDGETQSEIVVPIVKDGKTKGVIDLDCLNLSGFDEVDQEYLEKLAELISQSL
ncbi:Free methionine-R-sulfoxide reductase [Candida viswanathii]|uniref:Free methionine-R-sulfoxide reductase n=1 Tax=Candida viswanathii TaxID=5486 RepID=A0A367YPI1_9ASCO|nr:Free methionine-R-sulfoxide reductase [Candida viswanathii]